MKQFRIISILLMIGLLLTTTHAFAQDGTEFEGDQISFTFPDDIMRVVEVETRQPVTQGSAVSPRVTVYEFTEYLDDAEFFYPATIYVYNTADFAGFDSVNEEFQNLVSLLNDAPNLDNFVTTTLSRDADPLPFLPPLGANQVLRAQPEYMVMDDIVGIRYITTYSQGLSPLTDQMIFYTFQGVSTDGSLYISAMLPVKTRLFDEEVDISNLDFDAFADNYNNYLNNSLEFLQTHPDDDFTPSLSSLDEFIETITIN